MHEVPENRWWAREVGPSPAEQLRELLIDYRRQGWSFYRAWPEALSRIVWRNSGRQRREWLLAWADQNVRDAFWDAYDHRENHRADAVAELAGMSELVSLHDPRRDAELRQPDRPGFAHLGRPHAAAGAGVHG